MNVIDGLKAAGAAAAQKLGITAPLDPFADLCHRVLAESGATVADAAEVKELRKLEAEYRRVNTALANFNPFKADDAHDAHLRTIAQSIREGRPTEPEGWSREDWRDDFKTRSHACTLELRRITAAAMPLAAGVVAKFCTAAEAVVAKLEKQEAATYRRFNLPVEESALLRRLRQLPEQARRRVPEHPQYVGPPSSMVGFLDLN